MVVMIMFTLRPTLSSSIDNSLAELEERLSNTTTLTRESVNELAGYRRDFNGAVCMIETESKGQDLVPTGDLGYDTTHVPLIYKKISAPSCECYEKSTRDSGLGFGTSGTKKWVSASCFRACRQARHNRRGLLACTQEYIDNRCMLTKVRSLPDYDALFTREGFGFEYLYCDDVRVHSCRLLRHTRSCMARVCVCGMRVWHARGARVR